VRSSRSSLSGRGPGGPGRCSPGNRRRCAPIALGGSCPGRTRSSSSQGAARDQGSRAGGRCRPEVLGPVPWCRSSSFFTRNEGAVRHLHRRFEPPGNVEQNPSFVGVVGYRFEQQIRRHAVEEGPDVKVNSPVLLPAACSGHGQRVKGTSPRTVAVTIRVEDRLQLLFQQHRRRGLSHSVARIRDAEHPDPQPMILRYSR